MSQTPENQPNPGDQFTRVSPSSTGVLRIQMPDGQSIQFPLLESSITIGRSPDCDIVLDDVTVSRQHARLSVEAGVPYLEDLGSSNGTYQGNVRLKPGERVALASEALLEFGQVKATYQGAGAPAAPATQKAAFSLAEASTAFLSRFSPRMRLLLLLGGVIIGLTLVLVCISVGVGVVLNRGQQERLTAACEQPPMTLLTAGGSIFTAEAVQTAVPSNPELAQSLLETSSDPDEPLLTTAFMELPFPYDGGNENFGGTLEQFRRALQRNTGTGGRINSFFDHYLPIYPAPQDPASPGGKEPAEAPVGKNIVPFDGFLNPYFSYSGHPGIDFSTFVYRQPTTPVFAAADGIIAAVGTHGASGALYVKINHTVQNVGVYQTIYWHLHPDEYFEAMLGREGEAISAGARIGTMGNTGYSTGHHLHFEVRMDFNNDGSFSGSEVVDPFGWTPSAEFPEDPWFQRSGIASNYLWLHPLGAAGQIPLDGGGSIAQPGGTGGEFPVSICAQPGTLPPGGTAIYSWAPDPDSSPAAAGVGQGCALSVLDAEGQPVTKFNAPVKIVLPFDQVDLSAVDPETLVIYWQSAGSQEWVPLETQLDFENQVAVAETDQPGKCSLMGKPTSDILPPQTEIQVSGVQAPDGAYYDEVQVTLASSDPSGIAEIYYSLDNGSSWQLYTAPFTLLPGEIPQPVVMDEQFFGGLPGTFLILASAVDSEGNVEDPPATAYFSIDPSKNPDKPLAAPTKTLTLTPTPTLTLTATITATPTLTPTPTLEVCEAVITLDKNANCRKGPGTVYDVFTSYLAGQAFPIEGRNADSNWFWVLAPNPAGAHCWLSSSVGSVTGETGCMPEIAAPPTPTPKPVDTTAPSPPTLLEPRNGSQLNCVNQVNLVWSAVSDPSGIKEYQWVLQALAAAVEQYNTIASGSTGGTSVAVNLTSGCTWYRFTVRAVDGADNVGPYANYNEFQNQTPLR